jgi:hypothetical protein
MNIQKGLRIRRKPFLYAFMHQRTKAAVSACHLARQQQSPLSVRNRK